MNITNLTIGQLHQHYRDKDFSPGELVTHILKQAKKLTHYNSWIYLMSEEQISPYVDRLAGHSPEDLPLYGIPFAIKDNIDLAGIPTTAACKEFEYTPEQSAFVVQKLVDAGAIPIGKTNLDQFATGLVGTRSPWGACKNSFNPDYISGGSSSGSAVTVAQGLVSFALGTDTAGSGRVPAAFNNIIGMKPSRGLLSNSGVVPACKTLDCIALFATTTDDLRVLFDVTARFDLNDAFSRKNTSCNSKLSPTRSTFCFAVPKPEQLEFFGNEKNRLLFQKTIQQLENIGGDKKEIDFEPFMKAAQLLYEGPWVTERYLATQPLIDDKPESLLDVTRGIIIQGKNKTAADTFSSQYLLQAYKKQTDIILECCDFLLTPTAGTLYTLDQVEHEPVQFNSNLGYYTNYMNLLDYASIAVPAGFTDDGLPFGVTLVSTAFTDQKLLSYAQALQQSVKLKLGATDWPLPPSNVTSKTADGIKLVVCGAHMSELPLNDQLTQRHAVLLEKCKSAAQYKLLALPGGPPERPGMIRVTRDGMAIDVEVWEMPRTEFGDFLETIPHPLGLGKVELENGEWVTGFICEGYVEKEAHDISHFGGWRAYLQSRTTD